MAGNVGTRSMEGTKLEIICCGRRPADTMVEVLPRLPKIKYDSGITEEVLFVDIPNEYTLPSGLMVLEYQKAIQESVFKELRVVRVGTLRIIFSSDLKIVSWKFCARPHEELIPRHVIAHQFCSWPLLPKKSEFDNPEWIWRLVDEGFANQLPSAS